MKFFFWQGIPGVPKIINNYNPATWILEATSPSVEAEHGVDFADIYQESALYKWVQFKIYWYILLLWNCWIIFQDPKVTEYRRVYGVA